MNHEDISAHLVRKNGKRQALVTRSRELDRVQPNIFINQEIVKNRKANAIIVVSFSLHKHMHKCCHMSAIVNVNTFNANLQQFPGVDRRFLCALALHQAQRNQLLQKEDAILYRLRTDPSFCTNGPVLGQLQLADLQRKRHQLKQNFNHTSRKQFGLQRWEMDNGHLARPELRARL